MATGTDNEELLMEVQVSIFPLNLAALVNLAEYLKVTKTKFEGKSRLAVTKLSCDFLEEKRWKVNQWRKTPHSCLM